MAILIPYVKQTWVDNNVSNPLSAARLGVLEEGILDVSQGPFVQAGHNVDQATTSGVALALACNTETFDQAGGAASTMHDTATNNSRLTCRYAGVYLISADNLNWSANPLNAVLNFRLNGTTSFGQQQHQTDWRIMSGAAFRNLAVNDYVECMVTQASGGGKNILTGFTFGMVRVG